MEVYKKRRNSNNNIYNNNMKYNSKCDGKIKPEAVDFLWSKKVVTTRGHLGRAPYKVPTPRLRHSFIDRFLLGSRNNLMFINTSFTKEETAKGLFVAAKILRHRGKLLIVDTRGETSPFLQVIEKGLYIIPSAISISGSRWVGGTVSNWKEISGMVSYYGKISRQFDTFFSDNDVQNSRYRKMKASYPGFLENKEGDITPKLRNFQKRRGPITIQLTRHPDLIFVVNPNESRHIIQEANDLKIPVIALVDSNSNLDGIQIPIPVNYDTMFWVYHCVNTLIRLAHCVQICQKTYLRPLHPFPVKERRPFPMPSYPLKPGRKTEKQGKKRKPSTTYEAEIGCTNPYPLKEPISSLINHPNSFQKSSGANEKKGKKSESISSQRPQFLLKIKQGQKKETKERFKLKKKAPFQRKNSASSMMKPKIPANVGMGKQEKEF